MAPQNDSGLTTAALWLLSDLERGSLQRPSSEKARSGPVWRVKTGDEWEKRSSALRRHLRKRLRCQPGRRNSSEGRGCVATGRDTRNTGEELCHRAAICGCDGLHSDARSRHSRCFFVL